jgi:hypothetical protein
MHLAWMDRRRCVRNFGLETAQETATWKNKKEMGTKHEDVYSEISGIRGTDSKLCRMAESIVSGVEPWSCCHSTCGIWQVNAEVRLCSCVA